MSRRATSNYNLATEANHLVKEWHPSKNGELTPYQVTPGMGRKVYWKCIHEHEWDATVKDRVRGSGCPYCKHRRPSPDYNLAVVNPDLIKEWDKISNQDLTPYDLLPNSTRKVIWKCSEGHKWLAKVSDRNQKNSGCPYCKGKIVTAECNLAVIFPQIASEWHHTKNRDLTPEAVAPMSSKKVWWQCERGHDFKVVISSRTSQLSGCPYCSGRYASPENNLAQASPMIANEWHPTKNRDLTPEAVTPKSSKNVWWQCERGHEFRVKVCSRAIQDSGCPFCANKKVNLDNCLAIVKPDYAKDWHPTKNGKLTPYDVVSGSDKKVWWVCGRGHEYEQRIKYHTRWNGCRFCSRNQTSLIEIRLFTELKHLFNEVSWRHKIDGKECDIYLPKQNIGIEVDGSYWHRDKFKVDSEKNNYFKKHNIQIIRLRGQGLPNITDTDITFDDKTNRNDWKTVSSLMQVLLNILGSNMRKEIEAYLSKGKFQNNDYYKDVVSRLPGPPLEDSLAMKFPKIASEWNYAINSPLSPEIFSAHSSQRVWWVCSQGHIWKTSIGNRTAKNGTNCPYCSGKKVCKDNCLATVCPDIAKQWHPEFNEGLTPFDVTPGSGRVVYWLCNNGHTSASRIGDRTRGTSGCAQCN